jgi:hypothetical protein
VHLFWDFVIRPVLEAAAPRVVVEIGALTGDGTKPLLELCREVDAVAHVIDPAPLLDVAALEAEYGDRLVFHRQLSLEVLPRIEAVDAALIDGDHNWYTVFHELESLDATARASGRSFPIAFLHDVDWPYGRRDLYYDPDSIPGEFRHDYKRAGIVPGRVRLHPRRGINSSLANAVVEGGQRNGVRTAVEDFISATETDLRVIHVPGLHGLLVLVPEIRLRANAKLEEVVDELYSPRFLIDHCRRLEEFRVSALIRSAHLKRVREQVDTLEQSLRDLQSGFAEVRSAVEASGEVSPDIIRRLAKLEHLAARSGHEQARSSPK